MRELVFALEFKGSAGPVAGSDNRLQARTSASSQVLRTVVKPEGLQVSVETAGGETATFESQVEVVGDGAFVESGSIQYGSAGKIRFTTVGRGTLGPAPSPGLQWGAVIWQIADGEGLFRGAKGYITSNFTVGAAGEVTDDQFARLFLP